MKKYSSGLLHQLEIEEDNEQREIRKKRDLHVKQYSELEDFYHNIDEFV